MPTDLKAAIPCHHPFHGMDGTNRRRQIGLQPAIPTYLHTAKERQSQREMKRDLEMWRQTHFDKNEFLNVEPSFKIYPKKVQLLRENLKEDDADD